MPYGRKGMCMRINKFIMLDHFRTADEVYYYCDCCDITHSGEEYKAMPCIWYSVFLAIVLLAGRYRTTGMQYRRHLPV